MDGIKRMYEALISYLDGNNDFLPPNVIYAGLVNNIKWFAECREGIINHLTEGEITFLTSKVKSRLQAEANLRHQRARRWGMICMATGTGKSKVAIDAVHSLCQKKEDARILLVVPTTKLRDRTWQEEFYQWERAREWEQNITKICYASLHKQDCSAYDFVILDECHNITEKGAEAFSPAFIATGACMALTATPPSDYDKRMLLKRLNLDIVYQISLDDAVDLGVVAPYEVTVITMELDAVRKNVKGGNVTKPFWTTEAKNYEYYSRIEQEAEETGDRSKLSKFFYTNRMRFIYTLKSKIEASRYLLRDVIPKDKRMLIFCGSIETAEELCIHTYHSKSGTESYNEFINLRTNRLACVEALNEGDNIPMLDMAYINQLNSKELDLKQRIGRIIRFRFGHVGRIFILCVKGTVDEKWTRQATATLNPERVKWVALKDIMEGTEVLTLN